VRYLGTFLDDPIAVPSSVLQPLSHQLAIHTLDGLQSYRKGEQREEHVTKIRKRYGYGDIAEPRVGFRMTRWLYGVCWTGTERLGALFYRATAWLLAHKILLPGVTTLERFVVSVRARVEARLYQLLTRGITVQQKDQLQRLLLVPEGGRVSLLDRIRSGEAAKAITSSNDPKIKLLREVNPSSSALIGPKLLTKLVRLHLILTGENDSDEILTQV
jgi:hypothetical protein